MLYNAIVFIYLLSSSTLGHLTLIFPGLLKWRLLIHIITAALLAGALVVKALRKPIPVSGLLVYFVMMAAYIYSAFFHPENMPYLQDIFLNYSFIKDILLLSFIFLLEDEPEVRTNHLIIIGILLLLVMQARILRGTFFAASGNDVEYMSIGYGCASGWVLVVQGLFLCKKRIAKLICMAFSLYFAAVIAFYGNRGAVLTIIFTFFIMIIVYIPQKQKWLLNIIISAGLGAVFLNIESILRMVGNILGFNLLQSRNLRLMIEKSISYDSGRLPIYRDVLNKIWESPVFGYGIGADRVVTGPHTYAHNIILELCVDFGVFAGIAIYIWLLYIGCQMLFRCERRNWTALFLPYYTYSMVMLFLSGTLWQSGYLFAAVMIYLVYDTHYGSYKIKSEATINEE